MKGEYISIETAKIMGEIDKENKILQNRIDKAIEYIEHNYFITGRIEELHKILKGEENGNNK